MIESSTDRYPFSKQEIVSAFESAIHTFFERDSFLIQKKVSERAQVHCIANYFESAIQKTETYRGLTEPEKKKLRVDVEYNRYKMGSKASKELQDVCVQCRKSYGANFVRSCKQNIYLHKRRYPGYWGKILVDMVFHVRGKQYANIFCLEVKPYGTSRKLECDQFRVKQLIQSDNSERHKPCYRYGVALHFNSAHSACYRLYTFEDGKLQEEKKLILR